MIRRPPRSALFPYTTLFRSQLRPLGELGQPGALLTYVPEDVAVGRTDVRVAGLGEALVELIDEDLEGVVQDRKSTRLNSSHANISHAVFCLKKSNLLILVTP